MRRAVAQSALAAKASANGELGHGAAGEGA